MIRINQYLVSDDVLEEQFACNLSACKGACCVAGDEGAILAFEELDTLEEIYDDVKDFLTEEGRGKLEKDGPYYLNPEGQPRTSLLKNNACAYTVFENGIALCGIEMAWRAGKINWKKPLSCELYPIRTKDLGDGMEAINYERWEICSPACDRGKKEKIPVYKFLKDALIRKCGEEFYETLEATASYLKQKEE
jgi:hypothetical protein